ncbi:TetR family transcriptional regulator [Paenibacillus sambharensis]|uniref:TetR family transcriptional regulator n=1 Tax=Paenibacillus sambharensis TaxID=1803190 RepID=A0A2W1LAE1_9BACL|nr:TetR family transcriptional regulator C-terminal domain-containing protein [Paenibacillus sambharensis]PZD95853.1 TetR family transcriptional regulator [Paenibacillus sambharensis]
MPKNVNHEEKKDQIAEAAWRVILNHGMEGASVRNIAVEAGISVGALRHYFATQDELLVYAMTLVTEKVKERVEHIAALDLPPQEKVIKILCEIVPLNKQTMTEMEVWFSFIIHLRHKGDRFALQSDGVLNGIRAVVEYLDANRMLLPGLDQAVETERLYALVDGIALHAMLEPQRLKREQIVAVLTRHIQSICKEA